MTITSKTIVTPNGSITQIDQIKSEKYIERKIRTLVLSLDEYNRLEKSLAGRPTLLLWHRGHSVAT